MVQSVGPETVTGRQATDQDSVTGKNYKKKGWV
jgi:hypothetical protein